MQLNIMITQGYNSSTCLFNVSNSSSKLRSLKYCCYGDIRWALYRTNSPYSCLKDDSLLDGAGIINGPFSLTSVTSPPLSPFFFLPFFLGIVSVKKIQVQSDTIEYGNRNNGTHGDLPRQSSMLCK